MLSKAFLRWANGKRVFEQGTDTLSQFIVTMQELQYQNKQ